MAEVGGSPPERAGSMGSILGRLIGLSACAADLSRQFDLRDLRRCEVLKSQLSEARVQTLRQWLAASIEQQAANLREYLRESGGGLEALLAAGTLSDVVPSSAIAAEQLWFNAKIEALVAIIRGEDALQHARIREIGRPSVEALPPVHGHGHRPLPEGSSNASSV